MGKNVILKNGQGQQVFPATTADQVVWDKNTNLKQAMAKQDARISNLAKLPSGSTTGDAELQDIRTGEDGTVYDNAGEAVRQQIGLLKESLNDLVLEVYPVNIFDKTQEFTSKHDINTSNGELVDNTNYETTDYIKCYWCKKLTISRTASTTDETRLLYPCNLALYDKNKKYIRGYNNVSTVEIPNSAYYLRICFWNGMKDSRKIQIENGESPTNYSAYFTQYKILGNVKIEKIESLEKQVKEIKKDWDAILPFCGIYTTKGKTRNVYYSNVLNGIDQKDVFMAFNYEDVFVPQKRFLRFAPSMPSGIRPIRFNISTKYASKFGQEKENDVVVKSNAMCADPNVGDGVNQKCLFIGDSMMASNAITSHLLTLFDNDVSNITLLGTQGYGERNKHEGRGGWRTWNYAFDENASADGLSASVINPFYNSETRKFDFSLYMKNQGYSDVDNVFICLGTNDRARTSHISDSDILSAYQTIIDSIHLFNSKVKIFLWLCPFPSELYVSDYEKRLVFEHHKLLINNFDNKTNEKIYLVEIGACLDTVYDMRYKEETINDNTAVTYMNGTDRIHPSDNGYSTIADILYSAIKYNMTTN